VLSDGISHSTTLQLYPYHLSDVMVKGLRITPFKYYLNMMHDVMKQGLPHSISVLTCGATDGA
jgi:hypothetical protein